MTRQTTIAIQRWGSPDELDLRQQLGAAPKPPGTVGTLAEKFSS